MPYRPLGSVLSFPFDVRNTLGKLANPDAVKIVLFADDVAQATPGESVTVRAAAAGIPGLFFADADSSHEGLQTSGFYAEGKRYRAAVYDIEIDGEEGFGGMILTDEITIGVEPGSAGSGSQIVTLTVVDESDVPIGGIRVTVYDENGRFAGTGVSDIDGKIVLHLMPGLYDLSSPAVPGRWQMANPIQSITVADPGPNDFSLEMTAMPITPPAVGRAVGWILLLDEKSQPIAGAEVTVVAHRAPAEGVNSGTGISVPDTPWTVASLANGMVEFGPTVDDPDAGLLGNWEYRIWGDAIGISEDEQAVFKVPAEAVGDPEGFAIRSFIRRVEAS